MAASAGGAPNGPREQPPTALASQRRLHALMDGDVFRYCTQIGVQSDAGILIYETVRIGSESSGGKKVVSAASAK